MTTKNKVYLWHATTGHYWYKSFKIAKKQMRSDEVNAGRRLQWMIARQRVVQRRAAEISSNILMNRKAHGRKVCKTLTYSHVCESFS